MKKRFLPFVFACCAWCAHAQTLSDFTLKNVLNGSEVMLKDYNSSPGIVIIFTSVACPFDGYYVNRLKQLQTSYADKLPVLLVNAYTESPESEEWMLKSATANGLALPYLADKDQVLMTQLGAQRSPEAFVLKNANGKFSVVYHGAIDDNAQAENAVKQTHLKTAIENLLHNKPMAIETIRPVGCYIRKK
jgi:peroxiredoxin